MAEQQTNYDREVEESIKRIEDPDYPNAVKFENVLTDIPVCARYIGHKHGYSNTSVVRFSNLMIRSPHVRSDIKEWKDILKVGTSWFNENVSKGKLMKEMFINLKALYIEKSGIDIVMDLSEIQFDNLISKLKEVTRLNLDKQKTIEKINELTNLVGPPHYEMIEVCKRMDPVKFTQTLTKPLKDALYSIADNSSEYTTVYDANIIFTLIKRIYEFYSHAEKVSSMIYPALKKLSDAINKSTQDDQRIVSVQQLFINIIQYMSNVKDETHTNINDYPSWLVKESLMRTYNELKNCDEKYGGIASDALIMFSNMISSIAELKDDIYDKMKHDDLKTFSRHLIMLESEMRKKKQHNQLFEDDEKDD